MSDLIIATVRREANGADQDVEFDATLPVAALVRMLAAALDWTVDVGATAIEAWVDPPGRDLQPHESLAEVGAWDGARIILRERQRRAPGSQPGSRAGVLPFAAPDPRSTRERRSPDATP